MNKSEVKTVTVVPVDNLITVNSMAIYFDYDAPSNLHALQWYEKSGHTEWKDGPNQLLTIDDYDEQVAPYVELWETEKIRIEQAEAEAEKARIVRYNSEPARFGRLRNERDRRIAETDYLIMPDYPLDDVTRSAVMAYRQALRDLPQQDGAPWDGGGEATPWPEIPVNTKNTSSI